MEDSLKKLINFVEFTKKFKEVERAIIWKRDGRMENDAEHSYQLALVSWYVVETQKLSFNLDKIIRYALVHDLVEIYAGDTPMHSNDTEYKNSKRQREVSALEKIKTDLKEFPELASTIEEYELKNSPESKFVYALDKVLPIINIYLDEGLSWKINKVNLKNLIEYKNTKIMMSSEMMKYWNEILILLKENEKSLFP